MIGQTAGYSFYFKEDPAKHRAKQILGNYHAFSLIRLNVTLFLPDAYHNVTEKGMIMKELLIAAAASADIFAAVLGLSVSGIKLPRRSAVMVALSGAAVLWAAALCASRLTGIFPSWTVMLLARGIPAVMGIHMVLGGIRRRKCPHCGHGVLDDPGSADLDRSESISIKEGLFMGLALSADSAAAGVSAGMSGLSPLRIFLYAFFCGTAAAAAGVKAGKTLHKKLRKNVPADIAAGILLIIIAAMGI